MNARTAKLLRRLAVDRGLTHRAIKKLWNNCPKRLRNEFRQSAKAEIALTA